MPVSGMLRLELEALLAMARLPLAVPLDWGVKVTLKVVLWPAASATGRVRPVMRVSLGTPEEMRTFWQTWDLLPWSKKFTHH